MSTIQDWLDSPRMWRLVLAPLCSPFPQSTAFSFSLPSSTGFLPAQGCRVKGEAETNQQSLDFVPFSWHREGRKAAASLIGINTVTSHLLLPNKETGEAADLSLHFQGLEGPEGPTGACISHQFFCQSRGCNTNIKYNNIPSASEVDPISYFATMAQSH